MIVYNNRQMIYNYQKQEKPRKSRCLVGFGLDSREKFFNRGDMDPA